MEQIRNIGIIAHIDAGKTTLTERILYYAHKIHRMGEVHDGAATMDFMPEEQERGITIASACITCQWDGATINVIDTPGHVDFTIEVERSLRVLDGVVAVFCGVGGVQPQSETVWRQSEKFNIPKLAFINKMDRPGADFPAVLKSMAQRLGAVPLPVCIPSGSGETFNGIIDLLAMEHLSFDQASQGADITRRPLSEEEAATAQPYREHLIEALADHSDAVLDDYLQGKPLDQALLRKIIAAGVKQNQWVPVFAGSALRNSGVQPLMDAIVDFLPNPLESWEFSGHSHLSEDIAPLLQPEPDAGLAALVFKVTVENSRPLAFTRIYAGTLKAGDMLHNATRNVDERAAKLFHLEARRREPSESAGPGEIVAISGMNKARTGDTLCPKGKHFLLEDITALEPVLTIALEPRNTEEGDKLDEALARFLIEDPTLSLEVDEASGHRNVSGMGELHLDVLLDRIKREYNIAPRAGQPTVIRKETVTREAEAASVFERELGNAMHHGEVGVKVTPGPRGQGNSVDIAAPEAGDCPAALIDAVREGLIDTLQSGALGYAVDDVQVTVTHLARKQGVSSAIGFHMAAGAALREALEQAGPACLEPLMDVNINVPEAHLGDVIGLISSKSGRVESVDDAPGGKLIAAIMPLRATFGFSTNLRSASQGRAGLTMQFREFDLAN